MKIQELLLKYYYILNAGQDPVLFTNDDSFLISPRSVRELKFEDQGISFKACFNGKPQHVACYIDDIVDIQGI